MMSYHQQTFSLRMRLALLLITLSAGFLLQTIVNVVIFTKAKGYKEIYASHQEERHLQNISYDISNDSAQQKRLARIKEVCRYINTSRPFKPEDFHFLLVDDRREVIYCNIPKAGCTNWIKLLALTSPMVYIRKLVNHLPAEFLNKHPHLKTETHWTRQKFLELLKIYPNFALHTPHFNSLVGLKHMSQYDEVGIKYRLDNYFKFMVARHPAIRLLSAYRDKFENQYDRNFKKYYTKIMNKHYYKNTRKNGNVTSSNSTDQRLNFTIFADYIAKTGFTAATKHTLNPHWSSYQTLCHPCIVNYDYIAKLETLNKDFPRVMKRLTKYYSPQKFLSPEFGPTSPTQNDLRTAVSYYSQLSTDLKNKLRNIYDLDYFMFNYNNLFL